MAWPTVVSRTAKERNRTVNTEQNQSSLYFSSGAGLLVAQSGTGRRARVGNVAVARRANDDIFLDLTSVLM